MEATDTKIRVNGIDLFHEVTGSGDPLVLVHGGWSDHNTWQLVVPDLAESFRVLAYDRRGHSRSERPTGQGSRYTDEEDLKTALVRALDLAPAHVVGNSYGASIALGLAARRPELVRTVIVHEPPLLGAVAGDSRPQPAVEEVRRRLDAVAQQLRAQDVEGGARRFVEEVALGPGWWEQLPEEVRRTMVDNAPTFVDTLGDPGWADLDLETLSKRSLPVLLTEGDQSPSWLPTIVAAIGRSLGGAERQTFVGAGHVPHLTHPGEFVRVVRAFIGADSAEGVLVSEA